MNIFHISLSFVFKENNFFIMSKNRPTSTTHGNVFYDATETVLFMSKNM